MNGWDGDPELPANKTQQNHRDSSITGQWHPKQEHSIHRIIEATTM